MRRATVPQTSDHSGTCPCDSCNRDPVTCPDCEGAGYTTHNPRAGWPCDPQLDVDVTCSTCRGDGIVHPDVLDEREEEAPPPPVDLPADASDFSNPAPIPGSSDVVPF